MRDYILPDFSHIKRGYVKEENTKLKPHEQVNNTEMLNTLINNLNVIVPRLGYLTVLCGSGGGGGDGDLEIRQSTVFLNAFQTVRMNNEIFAVPEILFHPSDISIQEKGISEAIVHVINICPSGRM